MVKKIINLFLNKIIFVLLLWIINTAYLTGEENMERDLEKILRDRNTTIIVYVIPHNTLFRIPVNEERIRDWYSWKIVLKSDMISIGMRDLILAAYRENYFPFSDIRLLIDIVTDNKTISIPLSMIGKHNEELGEILQRLIRSTIIID